MTVNRGLVLSLGIFFIISGISALLRRKWALTLIVSASCFRILLLFVSLGMTVTLLRSTSYIEKIETEAGTFGWTAIYLTLAGIFLLEVSIPVMFLVMASLKSVKKYFETPAKNKES